MTSSFRTQNASVIRIVLGLILFASSSSFVIGEDVAAEFAEFSHESLAETPSLMPSLGRWPGYSAYLKAGPSFSLGDGFFADDGRTGFAITVGMREPLMGASGPWFFDFGGSFMTNSGRDATMPIPGQVFSPLQVVDPEQGFVPVVIPEGNPIIPGSVFPIDSTVDREGNFEPLNTPMSPNSDFDPEATSGNESRLELPDLNDINNQFAEGAWNSTLKELRRGSIHSAIGFYYQPISDEDINLLFSFRVGGRLGHAKGISERALTDESQTRVDDLLEANANLTPDQLSFQAFDVFSDTDTYLGVFAGIESILARQEFFGGDLTFTLDVEVANDFINLRGLKRAGLPTANILFGIVARR